MVKIISQFHCERLDKLLEGNRDKVLIGGKLDKENRMLEPTLVENPSHDHPLMKEEIFGPILPIFSFKEIEEVVKYINEREKPLSLYYYGFRNKNYLRDNTSSGQLVQNDSLLQVINFDLPFGGVGNSGNGA